MSFELPVTVLPLSKYQQNEIKWAVEHQLGSAHPFLNENELFEAFEAWGTPPRGRTYILESRIKAPTRSPKGMHGGNVRGLYVSRKMKRVLLTESGRVEFPAVVRADFDGVTREIYCQPMQVEIPMLITRRRKDGTQTEYVHTVPYTPDILRLTLYGPLVEEWKTEEELVNFSKRYSNRFVKLDGTWHCPEREAYFRELGITYCVRSSEDHRSLFHSNIQRLWAYLKPNSMPLREDSVQAIQKIVGRRGMMSVLELNSHAYHHNAPWWEDVELPAPQGQFTVDDVVAAIADQRLFIDLDTEDLTNPGSAIVCSSAKQLELLKLQRPPPHTTCEYVEMVVDVGTEFAFRGQPDTFVITAMPFGKIFYRNTASTIFEELSDTQFKNGFYHGDINLLSSIKTTRELLAACRYIRDKDVDEANCRFELVQSILQARAGQQPEPQHVQSSRTIQRWMKLMRDAGESHSQQILALVPGRRPGRGPQVSTQTLSLIAEIVQGANNPINPLTSSLFDTFLRLAGERDIKLCSRPTFYKHAVEFRNIKDTEGARRAYSLEPAVWYLYRNDRVHGGWPFHRVHIDHTQLDIIIKVQGYGGRYYKLRPWLTVVMDETTREVLAMYLASHHPSSVSCMMAIRAMVAIHRRVPDIIVVDNGVEFRAWAFRKLCLLNGIHVEYRPAHEARFGAVIERLFGRTNTELIHELVGNTKALKHVRELTKSVDPIRADHLSFVELHCLLEHYFFRQYNRETIHPAHDFTPEQYANGLFGSMGRRPERLCAYNMQFKLQSLIPVYGNNGTRTIDSRMGVHVGRFWYWADEFKAAQYKGRKVEVYQDPWDVSVVYAVLPNGDWCRCISALLMQFRALTQIELRFALYKVRLRLKSAPTAEFDAVLSEVLEESMTPAAEATGVSQDFYKPYGLAAIVSRPTEEKDVITSPAQLTLMRAMEEHKYVAPTSAKVSRAEPGQGTCKSDEKPRRFEMVDFKTIKTRDPL
ncbi:integrase catalytic subunit [Caballeronia pedi]|uniref:Integrase catalytic subunit n=1 Tax=Caballeronia pedi TaxID=1777141 RepID=A0A157ZV73_9BURK|nr:DDE-type integrase/transposase/recombinase [Caballeronia pedi]SAK49366.1 integrase catalytic subunit [Caballeronia pedi]